QVITQTHEQAMNDPDSLIQLVKINNEMRKNACEKTENQQQDDRRSWFEVFLRNKLLLNQLKTHWRVNSILLRIK
ncbi:MAG: hypothetical protein VX059_00275, partial [SAR324 cluster bacterium]|nr:hypothetical protein [SAR324 cluster bacterium]